MPTETQLDSTALCEQSRAPLFRYLRSLGLAPQDGEEVIQEVFLALLRHLAESKPHDNLRAWLFRVAHNLCRKTQQRNIFNVPVAVADPTDPGPDPEQFAVLNQRHRNLAAVIRALPQRDRACLSLRAEGFRYREIAEVLDISLGAVAQSIERSILRLNRADR